MTLSMTCMLYSFFMPPDQIYAYWSNNVLSIDDKVNDFGTLTLTFMLKFFFLDFVAASGIVFHKYILLDLIVAGG